MELHDASDLNAFQFYIYHLTKRESKSSGFVATGAEVIEVDEVLGLVWGHSGRLVDVREGGLFKPATGYHWDLVQGRKFMICSHRLELNQQVSWLLIGYTRVNNQSGARSAS